MLAPPAGDFVLNRSIHTSAVTLKISLRLKGLGLCTLFVDWLTLLKEVVTSVGLHSG